MPVHHRAAVLRPFAVVLAAASIARPAAAQKAHPVRPMHTFSIVAVDSATAQIGVAVQSHWLWVVEQPGLGGEQVR